MRTPKPPPSPFARGALSPSRASRWAGIPRTELYELIKAGKLSYATRASGRGKLIPRAALEAYLESLKFVRGEF